jgi:hypothetical protein
MLDRDDEDAERFEPDCYFDGDEDEDDGDDD